MDTNGGAALPAAAVCTMTGAAELLMFRFGRAADARGCSGDGSTIIFVVLVIGMTGSVMAYDDGDDFYGGNENTTARSSDKVGWVNR